MTIYRRTQIIILFLLIPVLQGGCRFKDKQIRATSTTSLAVITDTLEPAILPTVTLSPLPPIATEEINLLTSDGLSINGLLFRNPGDQSIILAHQRGQGFNQKSWRYFGEELAAKGYTVLTFDFRGIGKSEGDINLMENMVVEDTLTAIDFLKNEGYHKVICVGAETGGTACLEAAQSQDLLGVIAITAVLSLGEPTSISNEDLANLDIPKLFIYSENNQFERIPSDMQSMYNLSPEPKNLVVFPGEAHGTEMLLASYKEEFRQLILNFIEDTFNTE